ISVIGLVVKFSVAIRATSGSPGFDSQITQYDQVLQWTVPFCRLRRLFKSERGMPNQTASTLTEYYTTRVSTVPLRSVQEVRSHLG
ncbi:hypothetical protein BGZ61DRAFT_455252, partial [Ilyonectria robusta]|uniref:uncharacterized protein n=1 Tax=Ilyonectria robusta TaxID=1079257 RepID=UPI001E8D3E18